MRVAVPIAALLSVVVCPLSSSAPVPKAEKTDQLKATIDADGELTLNGKAVKYDAKCDHLFDILGKPDRTSELTNTIYTWDDLGVIAYFDSGKGAFKELQFTWTLEKYEFSPKKVYSGKLVLNGLEVTAEMTIDQINKAGKGRTFDKVNTDNKWQECKYKSATVYVDLSDEKRDGGLRLKTLSICPKK